MMCCYLRPPDAMPLPTCRSLIVVYVTFFAIRHYVSNSSKKRPKVYRFWAPFFPTDNPKFMAVC